MKKIRINYGVNRVARNGRAKYIEYRCGRMWIAPATWENTKRIVKLISTRHPGWLITGWCKAKASA